MIPMKKFLKNEGFTLVELIVVIAILGILAAVAVPAYSGYITKANDAAVITELDAIKTAAQAANATAGEVGKITVSGTTVTIANAAADNFAADFATFYDGEAATNGVTVSDADVATVTLAEAISKMDKSSYSTGANWTSAAGWQVGTGS